LVRQAQPKIAANLYGVSCVSPTFCVAVGHVDVALPQQDAAVVELWNGTTWSVDSTPPAADGVTLQGVSCTSGENCVAVGESYDTLSLMSPKTVVESWDGGSWSLTSSPNKRLGSVLYAVSCADQNDCVAVGRVEGRGGHAMIETGTAG
jgi:hypothetical protein